MKHDYSNRTVVVTGAASGMGLAVARAFAAAGARVVMADIADQVGEQHAEALRGQGRDVTYQPTDVSREEEVSDLIDSACSRHGALDVFVAAAGILGDRVPIADQSEENLERVLGVNVNGVVWGTKHAVRAFRQQGPRSGVIVNFASVQSFRVLHAGAAFYAASKAAVVSLTKSAALEYGAEGIRVVGVAPGPIDTPMLRSASGNTWPPRIVDDTPLARVGEPEEVAEAVLWLASDAASYVSGVILPVDGGFLAP